MRALAHGCVLGPLTIGPPPCLPSPSHQETLPVVTGTNPLGHPHHPQPLLHPPHKLRVSVCSVMTRLRALELVPAQNKSGFHDPPTPTACRLQAEWGGGVWNGIPAKHPKVRSPRRPSTQPLTAPPLPLCFPSAGNRTLTWGNDLTSVTTSSSVLGCPIFTDASHWKLPCGVVVQWVDGWADGRVVMMQVFSVGVQYTVIEVTAGLLGSWLRRRGGRSCRNASRGPCGTASLHPRRPAPLPPPAAGSTPSAAPSWQATAKTLGLCLEDG